MSEWRLATRRAAMQHAQQAQQASARSLSRPQHAAAAAAAQGGAAGAVPDRLPGHSAAAPTDPAQQGAIMPGAGSGSSMGGLRISHMQHEQPSSYAPHTPRSAAAAGAAPHAAASAQHDDHSSSSNSGRRSEDGRRPGRRPGRAPAQGPGMRSIMKHYRRIRSSSSDPGPGWLVGSPLLQVEQLFCLLPSCRY